ncbi:MAG: helix-turn-helix domain-containing protein [Geminicoccaceae bacterium]
MQSEQFHDFDEFIGSVSDIDATMLMVNPTERLWTIDHVNMAGVHVQLGRLGSGNIVEGQAPADGIVLYIPLSERTEYAINGSNLNEGQLAVLESGCEFCVATKAAHDWASIFVSASCVAGEAMRLGLDRKSDAPACLTVQAGASVLSRLRTLVQRVVAGSIGCPEIEASPAARSAMVELLDAASPVIAQHQTWERCDGRGRPPLGRQEIIRSTRDLLARHEGKPVLVRDLATAADISDRTLRTVFNEFFGVGPARYLQLRQLHQVHHDLRICSSEQTSVTNVLLHHGVWEFGRFASRYKKLFGKTPSATLYAKSR